MVKRLCYKSPIGLVEAPQAIAEEIFGESNEELISNLEVDGFIDPFRFAEVKNRKLEIVICPFCEKKKAYIKKDNCRALVCCDCNREYEVSNAKQKH